jgi:NADPH-dependent ferric siderophore reductase
MLGLLSMTDAPDAPDTDDLLTEYLDEHGADVLASLNGDFADSLLLVGRVIGGEPDATAVRAVAIDALGVDAVVTVGGVERPGRVEFDERVTDPGLLATALLGLVTRAGELAGEETTPTAGERQAAELARVRTFLTEVAEVVDVHPHLRRVTFRGGDLETFEPGGPDTFLYLLVPAEGRTELGIDRSFTWSQHAQLPDDVKPVGAYYTLRHWRPQLAELDVLMVLHGDSGPASRWALRAQPGDPVALWGPRTAYHPPAGTDRLVLVADETGLPAVAVILEGLPDGWTAQVLAEVGDASEHQELPDGPGIEVTWLHRDGAEPGTTTLLADAGRALEHPGGTPYVWGGGESRAMTAVRRHVRDTWGLDREAVSLVAYWRHASSPAPDPADEG